MSEALPIHYKLSLTPDLARFRFSGRVEIHWNAPAPVTTVGLNMLELALWDCRVQVGGRTRDCPFTITPADEWVQVTLPEALSGEFVLSLGFEGRINDQMAGFYRSRYGRAEQPKYMAVTQFQESAARMAFPCLDHPAHKATFDLELIVDRDLEAISNQSVAAERLLDDGRKAVVFQTTPRMSTYLLFFGVGEFEFIEDPRKPLVRVATPPGLSRYGSFGLEFGRKALTYCQDYYAINYPLSKMDLIAVPDFAFGAMENWGAITFRENLLLYYPDITSRSAAERICEVTAHEIVHQWFGNLVTPVDWKYLWLNESFATYFGYGVVDHYYPDWDIWEQFVAGQTESALARDGLQETFAIEIPGGAHVVINAGTAPIIYSKGGSILRQIHGFIGDGHFRDGLRQYLATHAYGCAASHHLWEALEAVSQQPVTRIMQSWVEQPGYPVVEVGREAGELVLRQRRFTYLPMETNQSWLVPVAIGIYDQNGSLREENVLLEGPETRVAIGTECRCYKVNFGQRGFYRVSYRDGANLAALGEGVRTGELDAMDRWGLQNDLYALVRSGIVPLSEYLDFLGRYRDETGFLPLSSIAANLDHAHLVCPSPLGDRAAELGRTLFERALDAIGLAPRPEEALTRSLLRDQILWLAVRFGSKKCAAFARERFAALMAGTAVHPDICRSVMQAGAFFASEVVLEWFLGRFKTASSEHDRMNVLTALGCLPRPELIHRALDFVMAEVPGRNQFVPIAAMAANPAALPLMWDWYRARLGELEKFHPMLYERVIGAIVPVCGLGRESEVGAFFEDYLAQDQKFRDVIRLSLEKLEINRRLRDACGPTGD
ncbi:MAG: M1 family metallopeptidase [Desulfobacteraceae bacterium]|nr:M1 family metallopeptidase [Desulfobacteraceae bacterium]